MRIALVTIALFTVAASAKKQHAGVNTKNAKTKATRKLRANIKAGTAAILSGVDDKLAEDDGYWDRFLQADDSITPPPTPPPTPGPPDATPPPTPPPTPSGPCGVDIETVCTLEDGTPCDEIPVLGPDECGPTTVNYCYTITNTGGECGTVIRADRTRTATPPGPPDGTTTKDLLADFTGSTDLCPGESFEICEDEEISTCEEVCYETMVSTEIEMPNGTTCEDSDMYDFCIEPGCQVEVETTCTVTLPDGTEADCNDIETPPEDCADGENLVPVEYCYTIENVGSSCGEISTLERTRTKTPPGESTTVDLLPLIGAEDLELCPGESLEVCEEETLDTCEEACYETTVVVDATMEDSNFVCSNEDEYEVCISPGCLVEVVTSCTIEGADTDCDDIVATPDDCGPTSVEYCYTISNPGTTCGDISTLSRTRTPPGGAEGTVDLLPLIPETDRVDFCPDESIVVCETEEIDTCDDQCYETTTDVAVDMEDGKTCQDTDLYEVCVNPGCITEVEQTCKMEGIEIDCDEIPPPQFEDCADGENMLPIERCFIVRNPGPTCGTITTFERTTTPPGDTLDLLEGMPPESLVLCTGEEMEVCETVVVNTCDEECYTTEVNAVLTMPDGSICEDEDVYSFCLLPPPDEECNVEVSLECSTEADRTEDGSGSCDVIIPIATRCDNRASIMTWRFNGGSCEQSFNIQEADKFVCTDFAEGGAPTSGSAYITVTSAKSLEDVYFDGPVDVGDLFTMFPGDGNDRFDADSIFSVYSDSSKSTLLQESSVHTSCSQNLFLKDKFGSVQLLIFENDEGLFTCFVAATYSYTLSNAAASDSGTIVEFTSTTNGVSDDCLDDVPPPGTIEPNETLVVDKNILIDMTVRQTYDTAVFVRAETPGGASCEDTATLSFEAGNPNLPSFGL